MALLTLVGRHVLGEGAECFRSATEELYLPVLRALLKEGATGVGLYFSGTYLEWLRVAGNPEFFELVKELHASQRAEVLAGLFYEPMAQLLDPDFAEEHLKKSLEYWGQKSIRPTAGFIPQHSWKPVLEETFSAYGIHRLYGEKSGIIELWEGGTKESLSQRARGICETLLRGAGAEVGDVDAAKGDTLYPAYQDYSPQAPYTRKLFGRVLELQAEFQLLYARTKEAHSRPFNDLRMRHALEYFLRSQSGMAFAQEDQLTRPEVRKALKEAVLFCQVECDALNNPEVEPNDGLVRQETKDYDRDGEDEIVVNTQLMRVFFDPAAGGSIAEFDYYPRKIDLFDSFGGGSSCVEYFVKFPTRLSSSGFKSAVGTASDYRSRAMIAIDNPGIVKLRFFRDLHADGYQAELQKDYIIKSGIGAHLSYSTTGLTVEYFLDGDQEPPPGLMLVQEWSLSLPSGNPAGHNAQVLLAVGGVDEKRHLLDSELSLSEKDVGGGPYGLRLIDGVDDLSLDLRSAKPLNAVVAYPIAEESRSDEVPMHHSAKIVFLIEARRIFSDRKANTLFLSIV